ncbi:uncharacterized protein FIESC28_05998 [Fusarium coffeatum]|uniref:Mmc1 C-terminal domain-containing protein n=1 Tax=Fusarium coffeatum TaxID=231269 RepID=A0A366RN32_9HYPO|nr:uncharacterized protein FIESC28_05998 [Fusarium coffeatum]RBR18543.1 hypothetical protein FIESC28_05998 [Fusarium coffeatum]
MASSRARLPRAGKLGALLQSPKPSICPFCSITSSARPRIRTRRDALAKRFASTSTNARAELEQHLLDIQKLAPSLVNLSRLQLALQGLRQIPGQEAVRVAILGLAPGSDAGQRAKDVLRVLMTDPLQDEQDWERQLKDHDPKNPLIVRIRSTEEQQSTLTVAKSSFLSEVNVSSAEWNSLNLELLFMETHLPEFARDEKTRAIEVEESVLVPKVAIPSAEHRVTPVTTPVHRAILVGDGFNGAVSVTSVPAEGEDSVLKVVDLKGVDPKQLDAPFETVNVSAADKGLSLFRKSSSNAIQYERLWFDSNIPALTTWLKSGVSSADETTKPAVRGLISSLLNNVLARCELENRREIKHIYQEEAPVGEEPAFSPSLNRAVGEWSQNAHAELQDELDLAFTGRRWRKLGWWQLFLRVDDVAMLTNEMLNQRFLPTAERELVYLAGQIAQAANADQKYPQPYSAGRPNHDLKQLTSGELEPFVSADTRPGLPKWPGHIAFTRRYLQNETVPALQALAQRLVVQSLGTSGLTTSLGVLVYLSDFSIFEAGAVAALGVAWSASRLQKKWDAARSFWEGEVREEGRKALRGVEESVAVVTNSEKPQERVVVDQKGDELIEIRELVAKAQEALGRMK